MLIQYLILIGVVILVIGFYLQIGKIRDKLSILEARNLDQVFAMLQQNLQGVHERLDNSSKSMNERLDRASTVIGALNKELGSIQTIGQSIKSFQDFLSSPKRRGNLGEQVLYESLKMHIPSSLYETQYAFKDGTIVDAIVRTGDGMIPIDSKFPMESFRRMKDSASDEERIENLREFSKAVKKHIDDIAKKYINAGQGTLDFAVMYVPSEHVFYELLTECDELMDHARLRRVLLVSPNSLLHFLRVILMGIERNQLQDSAKKIWEVLKGVKQEVSKYGEQLGIASRHVTNAKNAMDLLATDFQKISSHLDQAKLLEEGESPVNK